MHIIPATDYVQSVIDDIRQGDVVELSGHLVNVESDTDNWYWRSSQTRNDTGNGACELFWVDDVHILKGMVIGI